MRKKVREQMADLHHVGLRITNNRLSHVEIFHSVGEILTIGLLGTGRKFFFKNINQNSQFMRKLI
jgi:hypothetical protein